MFCRGILVIGPKRAVEDCGARYEFYRCSGRPDLVLRTSGRHRKLFSSFAPQTVLSPQRAYLKHSSKQQDQEERIEREEIIPKEIKSLLYLL